MLKEGSKILKLVKDGQIGLNWFTVGRNSQKLSTVARKWSNMQKLIIMVKRSNMVPYDPKWSNMVQKGLNGRNSKMFKNASLNPTCLPGHTKDTNSTAILPHIVSWFMIYIWCMWQMMLLLSGSWIHTQHRHPWIDEHFYQKNTRSWLEMRAFVKKACFWCKHTGLNILWDDYTSGHSAPAALDAGRLRASLLKWYPGVYILQKL